jgi:hypothetical protein
MVRKNQPSSIDTLPPELKDGLNELRTRLGYTVDQLVKWLSEQGHERSRSAIGRHVRHLHIDVEKAGERIGRAQAISKALMERFGEKPDNELARLNIQLLNTQVFDMLLEEELTDEDGNAAPGDSLRLVRLSKAVQQLLSAEKMNADRVKQIRDDAKAEERERAAETIKKVAKRFEGGFSKEMVDAVTREILKAA